MTLANPAHEKRIDHEFLYRALRPVEIRRGILIPRKPDTPFVADLMFPNVFPLRFGKHVEHAARAHQLDSKRYRMPGVSTTPHLKQAKYYAQSNRIIARIAVDRLAAHSIKTYRVADYVHPKLITKPEDDEVILVCPGKTYFPKAIIVEFFELGD
jgi:hypothetical protein